MLTSFVTKWLRLEETDKSELDALLSRCYRRLGDWQLSLSGEPSPLEVTEIIESYHMATKYNNHSYKGWHAWAFMNYEALNLLKYRKSHPSSSSSPSNTIDVGSLVRAPSRTFTCSYSFTVDDHLLCLCCYPRVLQVYRSLRQELSTGHTTVRYIWLSWQHCDEACGCQGC